MTDPSSSSQLDLQNLYVKNLPPLMDDSNFFTLFSRFGRVVSAKVMIGRKSGQSLGFGFVKFQTEDEAAAAINEMNGTVLEGQTLEIKYSNKGKDESIFPPDRNLYLKPLPFDLTEKELHKLFIPFGKITDYRILSDPVTQQSRQVGFVRFEKLESAIQAHDKMNGYYFRKDLAPLTVRYAESASMRDHRREERKQRRKVDEEEDKPKHKKREISVSPKVAKKGGFKKEWKATFTPRLHLSPNPVAGGSSSHNSSNRILTPPSLGGSSQLDTQFVGVGGNNIDQSWASLNPLDIQGYVPVYSKDGSKLSGTSSPHVIGSRGNSPHVSLQQGSQISPHLRMERLPSASSSLSDQAADGIRSNRHLTPPHSSQLLSTSPSFSPHKFSRMPQAHQNHPQFGLDMSFGMGNYQPTPSPFTPSYPISPSRSTNSQKVTPTFIPAPLGMSSHLSAPLFFPSSPNDIGVHMGQTDYHQGLTYVTSPNASSHQSSVRFGQSPSLIPQGNSHHLFVPNHTTTERRSLSSQASISSIVERETSAVSQPSQTSTGSHSSKRTELNTYREVEKENTKRTLPREGSLEEQRPKMGGLGEFPTPSQLSLPSSPFHEHDLSHNRFMSLASSLFDESGFAKMSTETRTTSVSDQSSLGSASLPSFRIPTSESSMNSSLLRLRSEPRDSSHLIISSTDKQLTRHSSSLGPDDEEAASETGSLYSLMLREQRKKIEETDNKNDEELLALLMDKDKWEGSGAFPSGLDFEKEGSPILPRGSPILTESELLKAQSGLEQSDFNPFLYSTMSSPTSSNERFSSVNWADVGNFGTQNIMSKSYHTVKGETESGDGQFVFQRKLTP